MQVVCTDIHFFFSAPPPSQSVQFDVRPGVCISGASPESVSRLLGELAQYGTHYLRLSHFSLQSADKKGLVFQVCLCLRHYLCCRDCTPSYRHRQFRSSPFIPPTRVYLKKNV